MKKNKGFTLIELLVAVAVFAIMIAIAAPNLQGFTKRNRLTSQINVLVGHLNLARSEAVKRNHAVSICISNAAHTACDTADPDRWEDGWIIFTDVDEDGVYDTGDGDTLLQVNDALSGGNTIRSTQFPERITYDNDGSANTSGTFVACDQDGMSGFAVKTINISVAGHISIGDDPDNDRIHNDFTNTEVTACT